MDVVAHRLFLDVCVELLGVCVELGGPLGLPLCLGCKACIQRGQECFLPAAYLLFNVHARQPLPYCKLWSKYKLLAGWLTVSLLDAYCCLY